MRSLLLSSSLLLVACVPHRDVPVGQISSLPNLEQVMDVQSTVADPQFKKIGQPSYTPADWDAFADTGARIQATSAKLKDFSKGAEFDALALQLHAAAEALSSAATAKDPAAASKALADMKMVCKTCHKKFK